MFGVPPSQGASRAAGPHLHEWWMNSIDGCDRSGRRSTGGIGENADRVGEIVEDGRSTISKMIYRVGLLHETCSAKCKLGLGTATFVPAEAATTFRRFCKITKSDY